MRSPEPRSRGATSIVLSALLFIACGKSKPAASPDGAAGHGGASGFDGGAGSGGGAGAGSGGGAGAGIDAANDIRTEAGADVAADTGGGDSPDALNDGVSDADRPMLDVGADGEVGGPACGEPASCPAADDSKTPVISCLSPSTVQARQAFRLNIYGTYLHIGTAGAFSLVTFDNGVPLNGALVTPCHITVDLDASVLTTAKSVNVVVAPGGRAGQSQPAILTVQ
jgi:hypothetical protein